MCLDFYDNAPSYHKLCEKLKDLKNTYEFIKLFEIGKTVLGRKIYAVGIGNLKSVNLFSAGFHANEWLTSSLLVKFLEDICICVENKNKLCGIKFSDCLINKGIIFVPMVNPDGVEIAINSEKSAKHLESKVKKIKEKSKTLWQANANGVDINHNFDAGFNICKQLEVQNGITEPSPRQYGGKVPHSEPETRAMVNLCNNFNINCAFAFHSQGEEIYYEYGNNTPKISFHIASLLASYCHYSIIRQMGMASHAGFKDWFIETFTRPAFTIEIGRGENPLPIEDLNGIYEKLCDALCVSVII